MNREQYEWANIWWNNANDEKLPRALLIGDSISVGYGGPVTELLKGKANVDRLSTSKAIDDEAFAKETAYMLGEYRYSAVHFNNGLHGWHVADDVFESSLERYAKKLRELAKGAKLVWASITPVTKEGDTNALNTDMNYTVIRRNVIAVRVMRKLGISVNDLYTLVLGKADLRASDGVHYNNDGYQLMGKAVAKAIEEGMGKRG